MKTIISYLLLLVPLAAKELNLAWEHEGGAKYELYRGLDLLGSTTQLEIKVELN